MLNNPWIAMTHTLCGPLSHTVCLWPSPIFHSFSLSSTVHAAKLIHISQQHKQCDAETTPVSLRTFMDVCALPPHPSSPKTTTSTTTTTGRHLCTSLRCDVPHPSTKGLQRSLPNSDRMALLPTQTLVLMCQAFWELALPRVWTWAKDSSSGTGRSGPAVAGRQWWVGQTSRDPLSAAAEARR